MALTKAQLVDLNANELIVDLDADTSITADTDDQIDIKTAGADDFRFTANTFTALSGSSIVTPTLTVSSSATISGGAINVAAIDLDGATDIGAALADADLFLIDDGAGGTMRKATASRVKTYMGASAGAFSVENLDIDGSTDIGANLADADLFIVDDGAGGTNRKTAASRIKTYVADVTLTTAAQTNITSLGTLTALTVDDITIDGSTISDSGDFTIDGGADIILDADGADIILKDGGTTFASLTNSSGELVIKSGSTPTTAATFSGANVTLAGTVGSGAITSTGAVTGTSVVVSDDGNIGSASDTDAIAIASNGVVTFSQAPLFSSALTTLTVDNIILNGTTIGHTSDTDLITLADGVATVAGELSVTTLDIGGTNVTSTATELNKLDGVGTLKQAGKESMWIPAVAMYPSDTGGCAAVAGTELASDINRPFLKTLAFDKDSDEAAQFSVAFPKSWNEGTITFVPYFTANTTNTGNVKFMLKGIAFSDNDALNQDFGTAQGTAKSHSGTAYDLNIGAESSAITIAGSPAAGDQVFFQIFRDVSADNLTSDALLLGIKVHFTTDAANDA